MWRPAAWFFMGWPWLNASKFTLSDIPLPGILEIILGCGEYVLSPLGIIFLDPGLSDPAIGLWADHVVEI